MKTLRREILRKTLQATKENQEEFTVEFTKKDQTKRTLRGKLGITEFLKGGKNKVEAKDRPYLTVYDTEAQGYRTVNLDTTTKVTLRGTTFKIV